MTRDEANALRDRRAVEQPSSEWRVQGRADGAWVVVRLPGGSRVDAATVRARAGAPLEVGEDPRPAATRNVPPYGPGV